MSTGKGDYKLRYPKGFNAYPHNNFKLEGYGTHKGYITLAGVLGTLAVSYLFFSYNRAHRTLHITQEKEWRAKVLEMAREKKADPIHQ